MSKEKAEWMSVPEAAEVLGISDVGVLKLIRTNELEAFRLSGRAWAVSRDSIERNDKEYRERKIAKPGRPRRTA